MPGSGRGAIPLANALFRDLPGSSTANHPWQMHFFANCQGRVEIPYLTISNSAAETVAGGARKDTGELPADSI